MAAPDHLAILRQGVPAWNRWRKEQPQILPNLRKANLKDRDLQHADFSDTNLRRSDLRGSNLSDAYLRRADLRRADLSGATLRGTDLTSATLIETDLTGATLEGCYVYGVSAWRLTLDGATQKNLIVGKRNEPALTVDYLDVAQFIYLVLNNSKLRDVITTVELTRFRGHLTLWVGGHHDAEEVRTTTAVPA